MIGKHYRNKRYKRNKFIDKCLNGDGNIIDKFIVDRGHPKGVELHSITDNGIIVVRNLESNKLVTKLIARPQQIKRYYESTGRQPPPNYENILCLAQWHKVMGYNK